MSSLKIHPLALKFPEMSDADFQELKADIKANGLRENIIIHEEMILDGRHRYKAMTDLGKLAELDGVPSRLRDFDTDKDGDPWAFVLSLNMHRRHLSMEQRKAIAAAMLEQDPTQSDADVAAAAKIDNKTAAKVRDEKGILKAKDAKVAKVKAVVKANPKASVRAVAKEVGLPVATVARAVSKMENPKSETPAKPTIAQQQAARYAAHVADFMSGQPHHLDQMITRQVKLTKLDPATLTPDQRSLLAAIARMRDGLAQDLAQCSDLIDNILRSEDAEEKAAKPAEKPAAKPKVSKAKPAAKPVKSGAQKLEALTTSLNKIFVGAAS